MAATCAHMPRPRASECITIGIIQLKFASRVDTDRCGEPAALGVIVGSDYGYQRPDGVSVIPLGALGP